ncbi:MAG TPA: 5'-nucleotidase C-terminal domain-containing protein [Leptospiraceae bacterium]|nr:5'-nucleotidase C-terminal domain-containing protein [Leptospiraceae bacterium]HMX34480.1 5'-nucleotidase C-terminal domain-containing protein [Leptospiraceae bacterium]HMY33746.1 5'-nucleotidase C-terminal domain-containing protein [Leptospiraceae bacterium]HNA07805.1 5'-nucleotidase C-terminal domain-containing protein [Leptospiraceae bacterium]HNB96992.1 5'-nucleotidase C-terminal domain-containing protein [Leptospiraceae bacterium]
MHSKKAPPANALLATSATTNVSVGAPKSIGLDLVTNNRSWNRGCETRVGNLIADSFAWKANADIGTANGGNVRDDQNVPTIKKGTIPDNTLFGKFLIFKNQIYLTQINAYRLKQALENSNRQLTTTRIAASTDDNDVDGPQHGNCYSSGSGSGRLLYVSSNLSVDVTVANTPMTVTGSAASNNLATGVTGARITRMFVKGVMIYNNPTGSFTSGWANGTSSCTVKQTSFTNSAACNQYTLASVDFQVNGGDGNFSFNPDVAPSEFSGDSPASAAIIKKDLGIDAEIVYDYVQTFINGPVFPRVTGRLNIF